ncbi:hypothetical protein HNY73_014035 [Argiope bruennichi]|uniref:Endonuclease/exonuclease/phosphatase domain-containing protein n=1 Tax=Argiope bruennichi TaxID=94029 RepID=A0A8T0EPC3_ARGBR|nr:hypothetical protein HNY73_014035 [Argiope bruennichi]
MTLDLLKSHKNLFFDQTHFWPLLQNVTNSLKIEINLAKSKVATTSLVQIAQTITPNIFLVQKPYVRNGRIEVLPCQWTSWLSGNGKAGILFLPSRSSPIFLASGENTVIVKIPNRDKPLTVISAYSSPAANTEETIKDLEEVHTKLQNENLIIGADMNAHIFRWGYRANNNRGYQVENFLAEKNL